MFMHGVDKELTSLLARLQATQGTPVASVLWDYYTGNFDRKWYATMADEAEKILETVKTGSEGYIALFSFIDGLRHSATDKLAFRTFWNVRETRDRWNVVDAELQVYVDTLQLQTYGDEHDEKHKQAKAAFMHLQTEMIRFTEHYRWGGNVWNNVNGRF